MNLCFGLPNNGGLWLAWAGDGRRYHLETVDQYNELVSKGAANLGEFAGGANLPVGAP